MRSLRQGFKVAVEAGGIAVAPPTSTTCVWHNPPAAVMQFCNSKFGVPTLHALDAAGTLLIRPREAPCQSHSCTCLGLLFPLPGEERYIATTPVT